MLGISESTDSLALMDILAIDEWRLGLKLLRSSASFHGASYFEPWARGFSGYLLVFRDFMGPQAGGRGGGLLQALFT